MMMLDPRLETSSTFIVDLALCHVRLSNNAAFPGIMLIPKHSNMCEIIDLSASDQQLLMTEIALASRVMQRLFKPTKLNVANLGNVVPQLHIHVIARYDNDGAWPGPVWNSGIDTMYEEQTKITRLVQLEETFKAEQHS